MPLALPRAHPVFTLRRIGPALLRAMTLRRTRRELAALDPHLLDDIGITRAEALREAARPVWDAPQAWVQRD